MYGRLHHGLSRVHLSVGMACRPARPYRRGYLMVNTVHPHCHPQLLLADVLHSIRPWHDQVAALGCQSNVQGSRAPGNPHACHCLAHAERRQACHTDVVEAQQVPAAMGLGLDRQPQALQVEAVRTIWGIGRQRVRQPWKPHETAHTHQQRATGRQRGTGLATP